MPAAATTLASFRSLKAGPLRAQILSLIEGYGAAGCIGDQVRAEFSSTDIKDGSLNTRFSELENAGLIFRNGDTRAGASGKQQLVMRHAKFADEELVKRPPRKSRNPFLAGMIFATKTMLKAGDFASAKAALSIEIRKAAKR